MTGFEASTFSSLCKFLKNKNTTKFTTIYSHFCTSTTALSRETTSLHCRLQQHGFSLASLSGDTKISESFNSSHLQVLSTVKFQCVCAKLNIILYISSATSHSDVQYIETIWSIRHYVMWPTISKQITYMALFCFVQKQKSCLEGRGMGINIG